MTPKPVPLIRWFTPIPEAYQKDDINLEDVFLQRIGSGRSGWRDLLQEHRVVILADAGAGKTFELRAEAARLEETGQRAFFIRIEDIDEDFGTAFDVGSPESFASWLAGADEAWFFLDSVDEVRLEEPRAFETAIQAFANRIHDARHRAHVYISSRPYAWRTAQDRALIEEALPFAAVETEAVGEDETVEDEAADADPAEAADADDTATPSPVKLYRLAPLDEDDIRIFAGHRGVQDAAALLDELRRARLLSYAQRPFDLEDMLAVWKDSGSLSSRLAVLQSGLRRRLAPSPGDLTKRKVSPDRAMAAIRQLAIAVLLTAESNIRMPGASPEAGGLDAQALLKDWSEPDIVELLSLGVFNDPIYRAVRFRHREVRELLAAEGLRDLLKNEGREGVEASIFREQYGEAVVVPRLRPVLPWLILFDDAIRDRALAYDPGIATEGGDAARLPFEVRRKILADMIERIADPDAAASGGDNQAIARIAQIDLEDDALSLIDQYKDNDDVIFFMGRLAWQGQMASCADRLAAIAATPGRGIYARIASVRAVGAVGEGPRRTLWKALIEAPDPLPRRLLAELTAGTEADDEAIVLLLKSIERLEPHERYQASGLTHEIHQFIERMKLNHDRAPSQPLANLVEGLHRYLTREPHVERGECGVSEQFQWLMAPALHAVERLIEGRAAAAFDDPAVTVLLRAAALRQWGDSEVRERKSSLATLVPRWTELNDRLFWTSVTERRALLSAENKRLIDDWPVTWIGHFWNFDAAGFERSVEWIASRDLHDDRLVALHRSFRTYVQNGRPRAWREKLKRAVAGDPDLGSALARLFKPGVSESTQRWKATERKYKSRRRQRDLRLSKDRAAFVEQVAANPDGVRNPRDVEPGQMTGWQYNLLRIIEGDGLRTKRASGAAWTLLIPEFGVGVAEAYRDASLRHWRAYRPGLRSEGADTRSVPYALIWAMAGLDMEAGEDGRGLDDLAQEDAAHALRFIVWELNGFPRWFESLYRARPALAQAPIWKELQWELEHGAADKPMHYVLHDIVYHAPWLHADLAPHLCAWLANHDVANLESLGYCRHIMVSGGLSEGSMAVLAKGKVEAKATAPGHRPLWHALWIDADPDAGVPSLETALERLGPQDASEFMQKVLIGLLGDRLERGPRFGAYRTPDHLKTLYALAHRHVRLEDDLERAGKGVYSPTLRDEAQDARNGLFSALTAIPGEPTYHAILALASEHPAVDYRAYMRRAAHDHAVNDSDRMFWNLEQVRLFTRPLIA